MQVKHIRDAQQISDEVLSFLAQDEIRNNVPLGILDRLKNKTRTFDAYHLFVVADATQVRLYAHLTPPFPLCLSVGDAAAVEALATFLQTTRFEVKAVQGTLGATQSFFEAWPTLRLLHEERQGLLRLTEVSMPPATGAAWEAARMEDLDIYAQWAQAFSVEAGDVPQTLEACYDAQRQNIKAGDLYCLRVGLKPVAMAAASRRLPQGRMVAYVYTPSDQRGKGYASELVAKLSAHLLASGYRYCALFTQLSNATSNRIYQRIGYQWVDEFRMSTVSADPAIPI